MNKKLLIVLALIVITSCKQRVEDEKLVYTNDFESSNLTGITDGVINKFNKTSVLGYYNNGGFKLRVNDLPKHSLISILDICARYRKTNSKRITSVLDRLGVSHASL